MINDELITNDKYEAPYLLAGSFCGLITFNKFLSNNEIIYLSFSPKSKARELVEQLYLKCEPKIPLMDYNAALKIFWEKVNEAKKDK